MQSTKVVTTCTSKKELQNWDTTNSRAYVIELQVPYDQKSIYWQMSGGTGFTLNTVNKAAFDMFDIGKSFDVIISPTEILTEEVNKVN